MRIRTNSAIGGGRTISAIGGGGSGGGVAASTSTVRLGSGNTDLSHNTAAADGGALALSEGSSLTDTGDAALGCLLTVRHNKAETGNGGGYAVSGDSSVSLPVSTAVFSQNVAAQQGGGLFIGAGPAEFDSSKAMECSVAKVTFWRLDLVDNAAPTGDGGGVCVVVYGKYFFVAGCLRNCHDNLRLILKSSVC